MTSVLPEGSLSIKERRQLLLQKGLPIAGHVEQQEVNKPVSTSNHNRSSSIKGSSAVIPPSPSNIKSTTTSSTTISSNNNTTTTVSNESFSSIKDRIKLLDKQPTTTSGNSIPPLPSATTIEQPSPVVVINKNIPPPPPSSNPSSSLSTVTNNGTPQQPYIPPPPASLFSFDKIKELHRDEYEEFEYQLKQTELDENNQEEPPTEFENNSSPRTQYKPITTTSPPHCNNETSPRRFQLESHGKNSNTLNSSVPKEKLLPPTISNRGGIQQQQNNNMVIGNQVVMKERTNISPRSGSNNSSLMSTPIVPNPNIVVPNPNSIQQSSPVNAMYHYPITVQSTMNHVKSHDEVQYPSAPSLDEIDFPEYQVVNNVQLQTMTSNIFKPISDSLSEVSEEEDYRMFSQFKEFIMSQNVGVNQGMNEEKLYRLYISFRERYQQNAQANNMNNKPTNVLLVNKSRVPSSGNATKAKPIVNPNSPTVSTTSSSSSTSNNSTEKKRDGLKDVRKKYEEQKLEEMRIRQMKERNKAHFAQDMQQPCMDYNALLMRENSMYSSVPSNGPPVVGANNSYPTINNPNDLISNGTYVPFKASHHQTNGNITSRAINNATGGNGYSNNYYNWQNNK